MKEETKGQKILKSIFVFTGLAIIAFGLKDNSHDGEIIYCFGTGLIVAALLIDLWYTDVENKSFLLKNIEFILLVVGTATLCFGLKDNSYDSKNIALYGGLILGLSYAIRTMNTGVDRSKITNTVKITIVISILSILSIESSIYDESQGSGTSDNSGELNDIEFKIDKFMRRIED